MYTVSGQSLKDQLIDKIKRMEPRVYPTKHFALTELAADGQPAKTEDRYFWLTYQSESEGRIWGSRIVRYMMYINYKKEVYPDDANILKNFFLTLSINGVINIDTEPPSEMNGDQGISYKTLQLPIIIDYLPKELS